MPKIREAIPAIEDVIGDLADEYDVELYPGSHFDQARQIAAEVGAAVPEAGVDIYDVLGLIATATGKTNIVLAAGVDKPRRTHTAPPAIDLARLDPANRSKAPAKKSAAKKAAAVKAPATS